MLRQILSTYLLMFASAFVWAESATPGSPDMKATRFEQLLDLRHNVDLVRHPERALELANAMTEPEFLVAAMVMSANPEVWLKALERAGAPGVPQNLAQAASPEMLADWFYSSIDPQFQQAILSRMLDPKKSQRWMRAMSDPRFCVPALAVVSPDTPMQWMKVTADGRVIQSVQTWFDPNTYMNWMRLPAPAAAKKSGDRTATPASSSWKPPQRY